MVTTTSNKKSKSSKVPTPVETDDNTPTKIINFSSGKSLVQLTFPQIITGIIFVFGVAWFIAANWVFETRSEKLKGEIKEETSSYRNGQEIKINEIKNKIDNLNSLFKDLKQRNSYLK